MATRRRILPSSPPLQLVIGRVWVNTWQAACKPLLTLSSSRARTQRWRIIKPSPWGLAARCPSCLDFESADLTPHGGASHRWTHMGVPWESTAHGCEGRSWLWRMVIHCGSGTFPPGCTVRRQLEKSPTCVCQYDFVPSIRQKRPNLEIPDSPLETMRRNFWLKWYWIRPCRFKYYRRISMVELWHQYVRGDGSVGTIWTKPY